MPDYSNGKIYKLWCPDNELIYIGSTIQPLHVRLGGHKRNAKAKNSCSSKLLFQASNEVKIELIEEYPCNNKMELTKKEGEHIRLNKCVNRVIPGRTPKEYYQDYKEERKEYFKKNEEKIKEYKKEWYQKIKEDKKEWYQKNNEKLKLKQKKYREANRDLINERQNQRRENNKDEYNKKKRERYKLNKLNKLNEIK